MSTNPDTYHNPNILKWSNTTRNLCDRTVQDSNHHTARRWNQRSTAPPQPSLPPTEPYNWPTHPKTESWSTWTGKHCQEMGQREKRPLPTPSWWRPSRRRSPERRLGSGGGLGACSGRPAEYWWGTGLTPAEKPTNLWSQSFLPRGPSLRHRRRHVGLRPTT